MRTLLIASAALVLASLAAAQPQHGLNLMPMPSFVQPGVGQLPVDRPFSVAIAGFRDATLERVLVGTRLTRAASSPGGLIRLFSKSRESITFR